MKKQRINDDKYCTHWCMHVRLFIQTQTSLGCSKNYHFLLFTLVQVLPLTRVEAEWRSACCNTFKKSGHAAKKNLRPVTKRMCEEHPQFNLSISVEPVCRDPTKIKSRHHFSCTNGPPVIFHQSPSNTAPQKSTKVRRLTLSCDFRRAVLYQEHVA